MSLSSQQKEIGGASIIAQCNLGRLFNFVESEFPHLSPVL